MLKDLRKNDGVFRVMYILTFFLALTISFPAYINSTFLEQYTPMVGILYTVGAAFTLVFLINMPRILRRFGNFRTTIALLVIQSALLLTLAFSRNVFFLIGAFISYLTILSMLRYNLDIFVESYSQDADTGGIRGAYLTVTSLAWVLSPLAVGFILSDSQYWRIYIVAALFEIPIALLLYFKLRMFKDPEYEMFPLLETVRVLKKERDIVKILSTEFLLRFFYSWMVIYTPVYLHNEIGLAWREIGIIFTFMLLPFILLELPVGTLADKKWGEKEFLSIGIVITAISTGALAFVDSTSIIVWSALFFATRVGASMIEVMDETYFFKHIDGGDAALLSVFRNTRSVAYIISPIIATLLLPLFDNNYRYLFIVLGGIVFLGLLQSLTLKDTK